MLHDILVFLDRSSHVGARLKVAAALAEAYGAGLIGLRVEVHPHIPAAIRAEIPAAALAAQANAIAADTSRLEAAFRTACSGHAVRCEWWVESCEDDGIAAVVQRSRTANLTIIGRPPRDGDEELPGDDLLHELVLGSGRPVLVVPDPAPAAPIGRHAVIAWNGTREASRALADALPLLKQIQRVTVLAVTGEQDGDPGLGEVTRHLLRNGIASEAKVLRISHHDAGAALLAQAQALSADLLVMGAYGRSRMREVVLGGATRHVLRHSTVPILMAH